MKNTPSVLNKMELSASSNVKNNGKNAVILVLGLAVIWLFNKALEKGYSVSGSYSKDNKVEVRFNPPEN